MTGSSGSVLITRRRSPFHHRAVSSLLQEAGVAPRQLLGPWDVGDDTEDAAQELACRVQAADLLIADWPAFGQQRALCMPLNEDGVWAAGQASARGYRWCAICDPQLTKQEGAAGILPTKCLDHPSVCISQADGEDRSKPFVLWVPWHWPWDIPSLCRLVDGWCRALAADGFNMERLRVVVDWQGDPKPSAIPKDRCFEAGDDGGWLWMALDAPVVICLGAPYNAEFSWLAAERSKRNLPSFCEWLCDGQQGQRRMLRILDLVEQGSPYGALRFDLAKQGLLPTWINETDGWFFGMWVGALAAGDLGTRVCLKPAQLAALADPPPCDRETICAKRQRARLQAVEFLQRIAAKG